VVHGDKYDYSLSKYVTSKTKLKIICKEHGMFEQSPNSHLSGSGCYECRNVNIGLRKRLTTEQFIEKAIDLHGPDRYDYRLVDYRTSADKVTIICKIHGDFIQLANDHLGGAGCPSCRTVLIKQRLTMPQEEFIRRAKLKHGLDKYDYSLVEYKTCRKKVAIVCKEHGVFYQEPHGHLFGYGCPECDNTKQLTTETFIERALIRHGNKYSYDKVEYELSNIKINITCPVHGIFRQAPAEHLQGKGCPSCARSGFDTTKDGFIYVLQSADMIKVGITNKEVSQRVNQINKTSPQPFDSVYYKKMYGDIANTIETRMLSWLKGLGLRQPIDKFSGHSECFYQNHVTLPQIVDQLLEFEKEVFNGN